MLLIKNYVWIPVGSEIHIVSVKVLSFLLLFFYRRLIILQTKKEITAPLANFQQITSMLVIPSTLLVWVADTDCYISIWDSQVSSFPFCAFISKNLSYKFFVDFATLLTIQNTLTLLCTEHGIIRRLCMDGGGERTNCCTLQSMLLRWGRGKLTYMSNFRRCKKCAQTVLLMIELRTYLQFHIKTRYGENLFCLFLFN